MSAPSPPPRPRSPLWMVVLGLACEEPMHPYRMQTLIKQRGKDLIANVAQRNSVYQTIDALSRAGLIEERETSRQEHRPERTTYEATDEGRAALQAWVRSGLATPAREFPEFPAVLSVLYGVRSADDLRDLLEARIVALEARLANELMLPAPGVPRVFLLETEYMIALVRAEIAWLRAIVADIHGGRLKYPTIEEIMKIGEQVGGPSEEASRRMARELGGGAKAVTKSTRSPPRAEPKRGARPRRER